MYGPSIRCPIVYVADVVNTLSVGKGNTEFEITDGESLSNIQGS